MSEGITAGALENLADLQTPPEEIKWREGPKGSRLAYVDARYVMRVLDSALVGPANWQRVHSFGEGGKVACGIGIKVDGEWLWKWDGAGETDIEGEKGSFSDAFKRAAVSWGIGRDLYAMDSRPQAAARSAAAPQRPVAIPPNQSPQEWVNEEDDDGGVCPAHGKPGRDGQYGWYCSQKATDGQKANKKGYCDEKPSRAWQAAHER